MVDWVGGSSFEGCLVFDECHKAKNSLSGGQDGGGTKASLVCSIYIVLFVTNLTVVQFD